MEQPTAPTAVFALAREALADLKPDVVLIEAGGFRPRTSSTLPSVIILVRRDAPYDRFVTWD